MVDRAAVSGSTSLPGPSRRFAGGGLDDALVSTVEREFPVRLHEVFLR